jgi:hypothetical protein
VWCGETKVAARLGIVVTRLGRGVREVTPRFGSRRDEATARLKWDTKKTGIDVAIRRGATRLLAWFGAVRRKFATRFGAVR